MSSGAATHLFNRVTGWLEEDDVDLIEEDASQQAEAGSEDSYYFHCRDKFAIGAGIGRNERDPDNEEDKHAEGDEFGLIEVLWQLSGLEGEEEADGSQETSVADQKAQSHERTLVASDEDDLILQFMVSVAGRRCRVQPDHTDDNLHESAEEDEQELQIEAPPFPVKAGGDLGLKYQEDTVGFHQNAGDAQHKADAECWLA